MATQKENKKKQGEPGHSGDYLRPMLLRVIAGPGIPAE